MYALFPLIGCAESVGISLASRVMYIFRVCVPPLSGVPGRYKLIWAFPGAGGGTVLILLSFWLCSGGYGTVEMVKRVVRIFFAFFSLLSVLLAVGCPR
jgi:hypothetical protein